MAEIINDLNLIKDRFKQAERNQEKPFNNFERFYKMYDAYINEEEWPTRSAVIYPFAFSKIEALTPKMFSRPPKISVERRERNDKKKIECWSQVLEYQWQNPSREIPMFFELLTALKEALIIGTSVLKVPWKIERKLIREKGKWKKILTFNDPDIEYIPIEQIYFDPSTTYLKSPRWIIHQKFVTLNDLKEINQIKGIEIYKNLDKLEEKESKDIPKSEIQKAREKVIGTTSQEQKDKKEPLIELWEYWEDERVVTIANRSLIIRDQPNPYWHMKKPFLFLIDHIYPRRLYGIGEIEKIERIIHGANTLVNQRIDNITLNLKPISIINPNANIDEDELYLEPMGVIHADPNAIKFDRPPDVSASSINDLQIMLNQIEEATMSGYAMGIPRAGIDLTKGTATGILALQQQAASKYGLKLLIFEEVLKQIGLFWLQLNAQFKDEKEVKKIIGSNIKYIPLTIEDIRNNYDVVIESRSTEMVNQDTEREQFLGFLTQLSNIYPMLLKQGKDIEWYEVAQELAEVFGKRQPERFFKDISPTPEVEKPVRKKVKGEEIVQPPMPPIEQSELPTGQGKGQGFEEIIRRTLAEE